MSSHPQALAFYHSAVNFRVQNNPAAALHEIEQALALDQQPEYLIERAWAQLMLGNCAEAERSLNAVAASSQQRALSPNYQGALAGLWSQLAMVKGQSAYLKSQFDQALALKDPETLLAALVQKGDPYLKDHLRQSLRLTGRGKEGAMGRSKLGGVPDLIEDFEWPEGHDGLPLAFIAQINLTATELPKPCLLPPSGMLYFFYEAKEQPWGFDPYDRGQWQVIYQKSITGLWSTEPPDELPPECHFEPLQLAATIETTFPDPASELVSRLQPDKTMQELYARTVSRWYGKEPWHRLTGHQQLLHAEAGDEEKSPDSIEIEAECEMAFRGINQGTNLTQEEIRGIATGAKQWRLLLQVDSDDDTGMNWGDGGRLYFFIRQDDLKVRNFHNVWVILRSY